MTTWILVSNGHLLIFFFLLMYFYGMEKWAIHGYNSFEMANPFVPFLAHVVSTDLEELAVWTFLSAKYHETIWILYCSLSSILSFMKIYCACWICFLNRSFFIWWCLWCWGYHWICSICKHASFSWGLLFASLFQYRFVPFPYIKMSRPGEVIVWNWQVKYLWVMLQILYRMVSRIQDASYENWLQIRQ